MDNQQRERVVAAAQARRDRERLAAAQADIAALSARVAKLQRNPCYRLLVPPVRRALRLMRAMRGHTTGQGHSAPAEPTWRGLALVIDSEWPQPDRDSGSIDIVLMVQSLRGLGFETILAANKQHEGAQSARDWLEAQGMRCLRPADAPSVERFLVDNAQRFDLLVLCRVFCGGEFLELAQRNCRQARLVFDSIDLNYLREERQAKLLGDPALLGIIDQLRAREEHVIRCCDATVVVSQAEATLLESSLPDSRVVCMPLARPIRRPATPFSARGGIGFIGGFAHMPNVDAIRSFLSETWPLVRRELPECSFSIVGADAPSDLTASSGGSVHVLGHMPDVGPWFESLRLTIAPLRFGAGAKGKVASSLAAGVPCVATTIATEGMSLAEEGGVLVADTPQAFAAAIARAYTDPVLWDRLSVEALIYAQRNFSFERWRDRLDDMLRQIGL